MLNIALQGFDQSEIVAEEKEREQNYFFPVIRLKLKIMNFVTHKKLRQIIIQNNSCNGRKDVFKL